MANYKERQRILPVLIGALIFAAVGLLVADRWLGRQLTLTQQLSFRAVSSAGFDPCGWRGFHGQQCQLLLALARVSEPPLEGHVSLRPLAVYDPCSCTIVATLRCPDGPGFSRAFDRLIRSYLQLRRDIETAPPAITAKGESRPLLEGPVETIADPCTQALLVRLVRLREQGLRPRSSGRDGAIARLVTPLPARVRAVVPSWQQLLLVGVSVLIGGTLGRLLSRRTVTAPRTGEIPAETYAEESDDESSRDESWTQEEPIVEKELQAEAEEETATADTEQSLRPWSADYDNLAAIIEQFSGSVESPAILVSPLSVADRSPRPIVNLAIALTRREQRVLLIEATSDSRDLSEAFDLPEQSPGFREFLCKQATLAEAACSTQLSNLSMMPAGNMESGELPDLAATAQSESWRDLRNSFDTVLLYSSAELTFRTAMSSESDATGNLLDLADGLFCVAGGRRGRLSARLTRQLRTQLDPHQTAFLGLITASK